VKFLPHESLALESTVGPAIVRGSIARAVDQVNQGTILLGLRCEVDAEQVRVGWWSRTAFVQAGLGFVGTVTSRGERTVVSVEIRYFPAWYAGLLGAVVVVGTAIAVLAGIRDGQLATGLLGGAWLVGATRVAVEVMFQAYKRRIARALRIAAGVADGPRPLAVA
jgi:hypothetical protein